MFTVDHMKNLVWSTTFHLDIFNVNHNGQANATTYFNFMQECALKHAHHLGFGSEDLKAKNLLWVVTRFELHILKNLKWDDSVIVKTWSRGLIGPYAFRDFYIEDLKGELVARASSSWIPIDIEKRKPTILTSDELMEQTSHLADVGVEPRKILESFKDSDRVAEFDVKNSDLDINQHVNNTKYIQWIYDSISMEELNRLPNKGYSINYVNEAKLGDRISINRKNNTFQALNQNSKVVFNALFF